MPTTRAFRSGNSQAVRIPADMAYLDYEELTIRKSGDVITIMPARYNMQAALERLRTLPKPDNIEVHEPTEVPDRPGL